MQSGFYMSGVAGQMTQHKLNDINHNLANVNTIGYMASRSSFSSTLVEHIAGQEARVPTFYSNFANSFIDMKEGNIKQTGNDLDFAIQGDAFFRVGLDNGQEAYTRAGNFILNANGNLLTQNGLPVLDAGGTAIQLPAGKVNVTQDGILSVDNNRVAEFGMIVIKDASKLDRLGNTLVTTTADNTAPAEADVIVHQGALEGSNVNSILAMTEMVATTRNFESTMKIIEQYNQLASQLYDRVGLVQG
jgi:flagellar basal body rod protein FlgG